RGGRRAALLPQERRTAQCIRSRAPGGDAAAAQVFRETAQLRLPRRACVDHRRAHARRRTAVITQKYAATAMGLVLLAIVRVLTGAQARWYGCPPKAEQRIYFANHQSHADLVMIWAALPEELRTITRPIAAKDYWT